MATAKINSKSPTIRRIRTFLASPFLHFEHTPI